MAATCLELSPKSTIETCSTLFETLETSYNMLFGAQVTHLLFWHPSKTQRSCRGVAKQVLPGRLPRFGLSDLDGSGLWHAAPKGAQFPATIARAK